jgi:hypothetical protein
MDLNNHFSWQIDFFEFIAIVKGGTTCSQRSSPIIRFRNNKTKSRVLRVRDRIVFLLLLLPAPFYILDYLRLIRRKMDYLVASCVNLTVQRVCYLKPSILCCIQSIHARSGVHQLCEYYRSLCPDESETVPQLCVVVSMQSHATRSQAVP